MARKKPYALVYDPEVADQLRSIEAKHHSLIRSEIETQLTYEPDVETTNRKPLLRPSALGTAWELRSGPGNRFRTFYRIEAEKHEVWILAIGEKRGNRLFVGGKVFSL